MADRMPEKSKLIHVPASRVMRARRKSVCPVCKAPINVRQLIAKRGVWMHIQHVIDDVPYVR